MLLTRIVCQICRGLEADINTVDRSGIITDKTESGNEHHEMKETTKQSLTAQPVKKLFCQK